MKHRGRSEIVLGYRFGVDADEQPKSDHRRSSQPMATNARLKQNRRVADTPLRGSYQLPAIQPFAHGLVAEYASMGSRRAPVGGADRRVGIDPDGPAHRHAAPLSAGRRAGAARPGSGCRRRQRARATEQLTTSPRPWRSPTWLA